MTKKLTLRQRQALELMAKGATANWVRGWYSNPDRCHFWIDGKSMSGWGKTIKSLEDLGYIEARRRGDGLATKYNLVINDAGRAALAGGVEE
jgi:hypothetical protein